MNNPHLIRNFPSKPCRAATGAALILTLGMLVLLSGLVLAFLLTVRTEFGASKAYEGGTNARLLADSALNLVIGQIREASTQPNLAWISQPGLIRTFDTVGKPVNSYKLYSADSLVEGDKFNPNDGADLPMTNDWKNQPGLWTDINSPVADLTRKDPFDPTKTKPMMTYPIFDGNHLKMAADPVSGGNSLQLSLNNDGAADIEGFKVTDLPYNDGGASSMPVKWLYVLKDGTMVPAQAYGKDGDVEVLVPNDKRLTAQNEFNEVVARIAFWTDDETAKVNINTASEGTYWDTPMSNTLPGTSPDTSYTQGNPDATFEWELAYRQGATQEYQRYSGHPATTCLSTIFGRQLLLRSSINEDRAKMAEEIFKFIPRVAGAEYVPSTDPDLTNVVKDNSSKAGSVRAGGATGGSAFNPVTVDNDRLYATIDEFIYNPNFATADNQNTKRYGWKLAEPAANRDTTREMIEMSRFFLTANSKGPEQNLYNLPRISIWPEMMLPEDQYAGKMDRRTAFDKLIAFCSTVGDKDPQNATSLTNPHLPFYFTRQSSGSSGMLMDAAGNPTSIDPKGDLAAGLSPARPSRNLYLMDYLRQLTKTAVPGWDPSASPNTTFKAKYGDDNDQILTEIFDYVRSTNLADRTDSPPSLFPVKATDSAAVKAKNACPYSYTQTTPYQTINWYGLEVPGPALAMGRPDHPIFVPDTLRTSTMGEVAPIQMATTSGTPDGTRGIGRMPTISGIALIVTRMPDDPEPKAAPDPATLPPYTAMTPEQKALVLPTFKSKAEATAAEWSAFLPTYGTFSQNAQLQFALIPQLTGPMAGYCPQAADYRITFSNISMVVTVMDKNDVPIPGQTKDVFSGVTPQTIFSRGKVQDQILGGVMGSACLDTETNSLPPFAIWQVPLNIQGGTGKGALWETPTSPNPASTTLLEKTRPVFISNSLEITCSATVTITGPTGWTNGVPNPTNDPSNPEPVIQSFAFKFPKFKAPMPLLTPWSWWKATSGARPDTHRFNSEVSTGVGKPDKFTYVDLVDITNPAKPVPGERISHSGNGRIFSNKGLDYTMNNDVVRTLALTGNATGAIQPGTNPGLQGDVRIIAAQKNISENYFQPADPDFYSNKNSYIGMNNWCLPSDSLLAPSGQYNSERNAVFGALVAGIYGDNKGDFQAVNFYPSQATPKYCRTDPAKGYGQSAIPATETINGVTTPINGVKNILGLAGDWDTGPAWLLDGPFCNKPDEGTRPWNAALTTNATPYIGDSKVEQNALIQSQTFFSPNRMIPSAVMFGSLPTGVKRGYPWQTLLFRPAKSYFPGGTNHPGSASAGPPDHLLLDLFWMPVVEPYAISEPFATAGKINLNQQIAPFTNIHRDTGLRAVMKSVKIAAINPNQIDSSNRKFLSRYKSSMVSPNYGVVIRRNIDLDNTIKQITDRLNKNRPFISATEICDIPLIPKDIPVVTDPGINAGAMRPHLSAGFTPSTNLSSFDGLLSNFWSKNNYTGDNLLEKPYALIYPRLTTRSNTYTVHVRVQTLPPSTREKSYILKASLNKPTGEFRGSFVIERYLDPNKAGIYDISDTTYSNRINGKIIPGQHMLGPYRFRVVSSKQFAP